MHSGENKPNTSELFNRTQYTKTNMWLLKIEILRRIVLENVTCDGLWEKWVDASIS